MKKSSGFTILELLVVITIIGVLTAIVLAALSTPRNKSKDAAIKADFANIRPQSTLYYDNNTGYSTGATTIAASAGTSAACAIANTVFADPNITGQISGADKAAGGTGASTPTKVVCSNDLATAPAKVSVWAIQVPLVSVTGYWCVDSTGAARAETVALATTNCP